MYLCLTYYIDIQLKIVNTLFIFDRPYKSSSERRIVWISIIVLLYAISIPYCYLTSGEPRKVAMINAQKLSDEKWERELLESHHHVKNNLTISSNVTSNNMDNIDYSSRQTSSTQAITTTAATATATTEDSFETSGSDFADSAVKTGSKKSMFDGLFGPTKEQRKAQQEFEKWQKSFKEKIPEGKLSLYYYCH